MSAAIKAILAREILDSRGYPTIETEVQVVLPHYNNYLIKATASVPSGASRGFHEALELRDEESKRYQGRGVLKAIERVLNIIAPALIGLPVDDQKSIDYLLLSLDGTDNKSYLGANTMLSISLACAKAAAAYHHQNLYEYLANLLDLKLKTEKNYYFPVALMNVLNGGLHANNGLDFQEFMIVPLTSADFKERLRHGVEIFQALKASLKQAGLSTAVGDEGGFAPHLAHHRQALDLLMQAIEEAGYRPGIDIYLALDVAASTFHEQGIYHLQSENRALHSEDFLAYLEALINDYPIVSIEDGMSEFDLSGWQLLTAQLGSKVQLIGDDLFATQSERFNEYGIDKKLANAILIKPNQVGTLTETLETVQLAQQQHYNIIVSHRSGDTEESFIADLAVAIGANQIKTGAPCRSERTAKYNQLLRLTEVIKLNKTIDPKAIFQQFLNNN